MEIFLLPSEKSCLTDKKKLISMECGGASTGCRSAVCKTNNKDMGLETTATKTLEC